MVKVLDNIHSSSLKDSIAYSYSHLSGRTEEIRNKARLTFATLILFAKSRLPENITSDAPNQISERLITTGISYFGPFFPNHKNESPTKDDMLKVLGNSGFLVGAFTNLNPAQLQMFILHLKGRGIIHAGSFAKYVSF